MFGERECADATANDDGNETMRVEDIIIFLNRNQCARANSPVIDSRALIFNRHFEQSMGNCLFYQ
jgi:hypothetical protein